MGRKVAFLQGGQIYVLGLNGGTLEQRTDVKAPAKLMQLSLVARRQVIFLTQSSREPGRTLPLPIYSGRFVAAPPFPRSVAGDVSGRRSNGMSLGRAETIRRGSMDMGRGYDSRPAQWSQDSKYLALASQSADFKSQEIRVVDVSTGKAKTVFHQVDDRWAEVSDIGWDQESNKIWLTSDQSGFKHLYTVGIDGKDLNADHAGRLGDSQRQFFSRSTMDWRFNLLFFDAGRDGRTAALSRESGRGIGSRAFVQRGRPAHRLDFRRRRVAGRVTRRHAESIRSVCRRRTSY